MKATVLVTHLNDPRIARTLESVRDQGPPLISIIVADGGSRPDAIAVIEKGMVHNRRIQLLHVPGSVAESRNQALPHIKTEIVVFLDADQVAPTGWLETLIRPIVEGEADFTGGPTRPFAAPTSGAERYVNRAEAELYEAHVTRDMALLPMGNSAWRVDLLRRIGGFDPRLAWGGEDYDVNLRALRSGARGVFVPAAVVAHDQSHLRSFPKVVRRKSRYYFGAATAYIKNDVLRERSGKAAKRFRVRHPIDVLDVVLKPWALMKARRYARRVFRTASA